LRRKYRGLSIAPKLGDWILESESVGERSIRGEVEPARFGGLYRSENAGMSNAKCVRNTLTESPRVPGEG